MGPKAMARLFAGRVHYAWVVVAVMFVVILASVGVRATPGVLIVPLQDAFGWSTGVISGAVSLNILLFGLVGPFAAGLIQTIGLKRTVLISMVLLVIGSGLSAFVTEIWQLYLTWGVLVGLGSGAGMVGLATAIANRWFVERRGLVVGLLTASNASGQLVFLPLLASLVVSHGWHSVPLVVALVILALIPVVLLMLPESPAAIGIGAFGTQEVVALPPVSGNPFVIAISGLMRGVRSLDFWLLFVTFAVCGFSTNGLVGTHLIPFCMDHGITEVSAASLLAVMGVFDLIGTTLSGYLTDRFNPRILLFWYYATARAFPGGAAVHAVRRGQPGDLLGLLRPGLGGDDSADGDADERGVRQEGRAGDGVVDRRGPSDRRGFGGSGRWRDTVSDGKLRAGVPGQWRRVPDGGAAGVAHRARQAGGDGGGGIARFLRASGVRRQARRAIGTDRARSKVSAIACREKCRRA